MTIPPLYLDDSTYNKALVQRLRQAGYVVQTPLEVGLAGVSDADHLAYAARNGYPLLTKDARDFKSLHDEWQAQGRSHAGILLHVLNHWR